MSSLYLKYAEGNWFIMCNGDFAYEKICSSITEPKLRFEAIHDVGGIITIQNSVLLDTSKEYKIKELPDKEGDESFPPVLTRRTISLCKHKEFEIVY